jgi:ubiquitin C-terminal hydrolase
VTATAIVLSTAGTGQTETTITSLDKLNTEEDRKMLCIPLQVIKQHLIDNMVPYCDWNSMQLMDGVQNFYWSVLSKENVEENCSDFIQLLQPPGMKNDGNLCSLNNWLQCFSLNAAF